MLPGGVLSSSAVYSDFVLAKQRAVTKLLDYEDGGIAINDPSEGLLYQEWRGRLIGNDIVLDAPEASPTTIYSASGISEISFTFDQNMRPAVTYVQDGAAKLRWFNTTIEDYEIITLEDSVSPRVVLDDKRTLQSALNDIIWAYIRLGQLCYRQQRDRFLIEYVLHSGPMDGLLLKMGMNAGFRMQFMIGEYVAPTSSGQVSVWIAM